jgi:acetyltransferase-like isoleucine patch superfamily enzyme
MIDRVAQLAQAERVAMTLPEVYTRLENPSVLRAKSCRLLEGGEIWVSGNPEAPDADIRISGPGARLYLSDRAKLHRTKIVIIGANCIAAFGARVRVRPVLISVKGKDNTFAMGAGATWESGSAICEADGQHIIIGDGCMLSSNVMIRTDDGHGIFDARTKVRLNVAKPVVLEPLVWIGNGARVNKGVRVGTGSVLGGASIATKDLAPHCAYAGIPAQKVREGIVWSRTASWADVPERLVKLAQEDMALISNQAPQDA